MCSCRQASCQGFCPYTALSICYVLAEGRPCNKLSLQAFHAPATASQASDPQPCMVSNLHMHCTSLWTCYLRWVIVLQAYPHKILTGRRSRMPTIRQTGGMSGFTNRSESEYDPFGAGHSSTSISAALGMAVARDFKVCKQCRRSECSAHLLFVQQAWQPACWHGQIRTCCAPAAVAWTHVMDMVG